MEEYVIPIELKTVKYSDGMIHQRIQVTPVKIFNVVV
jgi:hypothetical protein